MLAMRQRNCSAAIRDLSVSCECLGHYSAQPNSRNLLCCLWKTNCAESFPYFSGGRLVGRSLGADIHRCGDIPERKRRPSASRCQRKVALDKRSRVSWFRSAQIIVCACPGGSKNCE